MPGCDVTLDQGHRFVFSHRTHSTRFFDRKVMLGGQDLSGHALEAIFGQRLKFQNQIGLFSLRSSDYESNQWNMLDFKMTFRTSLDLQVDFPSVSFCCRPSITSLLCRFAQQELPGFEFSSIQVNKDSISWRQL